MREKGLFKIIDRWLGIPLVLVLAAWSRAFGVFVTGRPRLGPGDKVLVIKLSALGDTLLILPLLKALRAQVGKSGRVELVCTTVNQAALQGLPWVDSVHVLAPATAFLRPLQLWRWLRALQRQRFELCLDLDQWVRATALLAWFSAARQRAGFHSPGQHRHYLHHASTPNHAREHEFEQFKRLAVQAGVDAALIAPFGGFLRRERLFGARASSSSGRQVILHAGCGGKGWQREWPEERYAALARQLHAEGERVLLSALGGREEAQARRIAQLSLGAASLLPLSGDLTELVQALQASRLLVCGNTGVMHLAAGLGVPVLALHGPTDPVKWGPLAETGKSRVLQAGLGCSPCLALGFEYGCEERPCMEAITVSRVERAARELLAA